MTGVGSVYCRELTWVCSTIRNSVDWYKRSRMNHKVRVKQYFLASQCMLTNSLCDVQFNIGTSAYAQMLRIMSHFHEEIYSDPDKPTGLNQNLDFRSSIINHDEELMAYFKEWQQRLDHDCDLTGMSCVVYASWNMGSPAVVQILR